MGDPEWKRLTAGGMTSGWCEGCTGCRRSGRGWLDLEPGVLKVEVSLDPVHHVVADRARVAELDDGVSLGLEQLAHQPLPGARAGLVAVVLDLAGLSLEA